MPKVHEIGKKHFLQILHNYKVQWGSRVVVKGTTQEIEPPFRTATPFILRLPFNKALVLGKWSGKINDETYALNLAIQGRVLTDEDFQEGWTAPAYQNTKKSS
jgi:hypothetical protein